MTGGSGTTTVDGHRLAYRRAGTDGPAVCLLHGGGVDDATLSWRHAIDDLATDHRVYALDWPGYGASPDGITHSIESYVSLLEGFLAAVGLDSPTLVGISMGGAAAARYALDNPAGLARLVLVDSYGLGARIPAGSLWKSLAHVPGANAMGWAALGTSPVATRVGLGNVVADPGSLTGEFIDAVHERAGRPGAGRAFEAFQRNELAADGTVATDLTADGALEACPVPTLLVHGAEDPLFPVEWSIDAAESLPNACLEVIEDCGHWPPRERPAQFNRALRAFLESTPLE